MTPTRILVALVALLMVMAAVFASGWSAGTARVQAKWDKAKFSQIQVARAREQSMNQQLQGAEHAAAEREKKLRADAAAAAAVAVGLRDTVAALRRSVSNYSVEACRQAADTALAVFGECAAEVGRLAAAADGHASDVQTLTDAWPE